jgi:hypothetical protein
MWTHVMNMGLDLPNTRHPSDCHSSLPKQRVRFVLQSKIVACTSDVSQPTY